MQYHSLFRYSLLISQHNFVNSSGYSPPQCRLLHHTACRSRQCNSSDIEYHSACKIHVSLARSIAHRWAVLACGSVVQLSNWPTSSKALCYTVCFTPLCDRVLKGLFCSLLSFPLVSLLPAIVRFLRLLAVFSERISVSSQQRSVILAFIFKRTVSFLF